MPTENLTIGKQDFEVEVKDLNQADLKFYTENPRVYSALNYDGTEPTQEEIEDYMCNMEHVKQLRLSIESNGGLIDPLIVRDGDLTVLEGNSRLAAYRILCKTNPAKWGKIKCKLLPADIPEESIFDLLGQYHIVGRKDWDPFEQASYLYRRHTETKIPIEFMAQELGITKQKATKMIEVIEFMIAHDDLNKRNWSYYEEYLKNPSIKKYRGNDATLDNTIVESVKSGLIHEASDIRLLGQIAKIGDKQSKKLLQKISEGKETIYEAHDELLKAGKLEDVVKKLKDFKTYIGTQEFVDQLMVSDEVTKKAKFEIKRIISRLTQVQKKLGD